MSLRDDNGGQGSEVRGQGSASGGSDAAVSDVLPVNRHTATEGLSTVFYWCSEGKEEAHELITVQVWRTTCTCMSAEHRYTAEHRQVLPEMERTAETRTDEKKKKKQDYSHTHTTLRHEDVLRLETQMWVIVRF